MGDRAALIGIGNRLRGDDGAGPELARHVVECAPGVAVLEHDGDPTGLIDIWDRRRLVVAVDAVAPAGRPGHVHRAVVGDGPLPFIPAPAASTHALDLAGTIELARALGRLPERLVVYGVEGRRFELGDGLSPDVAAALVPLADAVIAELGRVRA